MSLATQLAIESPLVSAAAVSAVEYPDLVRRYRITGVPMTVVNDRNEIVGALPEPMFVEQVLAGLTSAPAEATSTDTQA